MTDGPYRDLNYWDILELALSYVPDETPCKQDALKSLDHLRERVGDRQKSAPPAALSSPETATAEGMAGYSEPEAPGKNTAPSERGNPRPQTSLPESVALSSPETPE